MYLYCGTRRERVKPLYNIEMSGIMIWIMINYEMKRIDTFEYKNGLLYPYRGTVCIVRAYDPNYCFRTMLLEK